MSTKKTIVIIGATGIQGSSVAGTFLSLENWHVRAVTRNPSSAAAKALASQGASILQANLSDINSLSAAFKGAHAIFVNTDFWGPYLGSSVSGVEPKSSTAAFNEELQQGKNAAIAAAEIPTLERFIYSALGPIKKYSEGKYSHSYHWDSKAAIVEYIETEQPELAKKTSYFYPSVYASNPLFMPKWNAAAGKYQFLLPLRSDTKIPIINTEESTGPFVRALIEDEPPRTKLLAYNSLMSVGDVVDVWSKATGQAAKLITVTAEWMNVELGIPWEVLEAPGFIEEFGYMGGVDDYISPSQLKSKVNARTFEDWLMERNWEQVLVAGKEELASVRD